MVIIRSSIFIPIFLFFITLSIFSPHAHADAVSKRHPKVSVICPTYDRAEWHPNLYRAFAWQTYEDRELLILDDSLEPSPFFLQLNDPRVKYYHNPTRLSIGLKRNYLNERASGEIIAHFDDDDYYAPEYLMEMIDQLGDADFIKYSRWLAWRELDGTLWEWDTNFIGGPHYLVSGWGCSNILVDMRPLFESDLIMNEWNNGNKWGFGFSYVYRKSIWKECPFEDLNGGEDGNFVAKARALGKKITHIPDFKHLALHTVHEKSTSKIFPQYRCPVSILEKNAEPWLVNILKTRLMGKKQLQELFQPFFVHDPHLKSFVGHHNFDEYEICSIGNGSVYCIEKESPDLIKGFIKKGCLWEDHIFQQFKLHVKPGSTVIDVGGHIGVHTLSLSGLVGENGVVHVFEPQAKLFTELVVNMHLNHRSNIIFHRTALGDKKTIVEMNLRNPTNEGNTSVGLGGDKVPMQRLDDFKFTNVSLIKIDVEGYEDQVIEGALETIANQKPILIIEIWSDSECEKKIEKITKLGYKSFNLSGVHDYLFIPN